MSSLPSTPSAPSRDPRKFADPVHTLDGSRRASVGLRTIRTLWFNTGTLCNLECVNCYIESSPKNDRLVYLGAAEVARFLDELDRDWQADEIGFTGGEPFMNPQIIAMLEDALSRGYRALVLTNAMRPMMKLKPALADLRARFGARLSLRVSLDHYSPALHDLERGAHAWRRTLPGLAWLAESGIALTIAGRTLWHEDEAALRAGYRELFAELGLTVDADDPGQLVLFPEMDLEADVPEISTACWGLLNVDPADMMCATSRMVVHRKGEPAAKVLPCTLLPYDGAFEMGTNLAGARADVPLNHPHCAKFCVLGGGSCSAG